MATKIELNREDKRNIAHLLKGVSLSKKVMRDRITRDYKMMERQYADYTNPKFMATLYVRRQMISEMGYIKIIKNK